MPVEIHEVFILCVTGLNAAYDLRKKQILLWPTVVFAAAGVIFNLVRGEGAFFIIYGLIPGVLMAGLSFLSGSAVGLGDAIFIGTLGVWTGGKEALLTLLIAFGIQAAVSVLYRILGGRKKELPFIPAVLAAHILLLIL